VPKSESPAAHRKFSAGEVLVEKLIDAAQSAKNRVIPLVNAAEGLPLRKQRLPWGAFFINQASRLRRI
jgi:hypothetical protein